MCDWIPVPYEPLSGFDVAVVSPAGVVHRFDSLVPNRSTDLVDLEHGVWAVHNDSPFIIRMQADSDNGYCHIATLCPSEYCQFDGSNGGHKLTATLCISAQVFHRWSMDAAVYVQRAKSLRLTKWEYLFYQYMVAAGTACSRVPEGLSKTPDFTVVLSGRIVPVELKDFSPNPDEKRNEELCRTRGYGEIQNPQMGQRIARAVQSARPQLRAFVDQKGDGPAILAIMNSRALGHADPEHLAALFEGMLTVDVSVESGSFVSAYRKEDRRRLPHERNRIVSTIAVLSFCPKVGLAVQPEAEAVDHQVVVNLHVYHNPHAEHPLPSNVLASFGFPQYRIGLEQ